MKIYLTSDMDKNYTSAQVMWNEFEKHCRTQAASTLVVSKGGISTGKDPTWWNEDVKSKIKLKKQNFKM